MSVLFQGGDLFEAIVKATKYTERDASHMVRDLASALDYLHKMNVVHRDIKPENLLVSAHFVCLFVYYHVTGVCLPSQSVSEKHSQEKKSTYLCTPHEFLKRYVCHV